MQEIIGKQLDLIFSNIYVNLQGVDIENGEKFSSDDKHSFSNRKFFQLS